MCFLRARRGCGSLIMIDRNPASNHGPIASLFQGSSIVASPIHADPGKPQPLVFLYPQPCLNVTDPFCFMCFWTLFANCACSTSKTLSRCLICFISSMACPATASQPSKSRAVPAARHDHTNSKCALAFRGFYHRSEEKID